MATIDDGSAVVISLDVVLYARVPARKWG